MLVRAGFKPALHNHLGSKYFSPEGDNLVVGIVANVGAPEPRNSGTPAPVAGDLFLVHSEIRLVWGDAAAAPQPEARYAPDLGIARDLKQRPVDPVHGLPDLLQHEHVPLEVGLQRRAKNLAKHRHV